MVSPERIDDFEHVVPSKHLKHDKGWNWREEQEVLEDLQGAVYYDRKKDAYLLYSRGKAYPFGIDGDKAIMITIYYVDKPEKFNRSNRWKLIKSR